MKKENTAMRLKQIMDEKHLRQIDILNLTIPYCEKYNVKMNKSDISQYCSGKTEPNQNKLFILGKALNVNETWLMGFDVPRERPGSAKQFPEKDSYEHLVITEMQKMNQKGKIKLLDTAREMTCNPLYNGNYMVELNAAHVRTDIEISEEIDISEDDIMDDENF